MKPQYKLTITGTQRVIIVSALMRFGVPGDCIHSLAAQIAASQPFDPADDGPEVAILRAGREMILDTRSGRFEICTPCVEEVPR